MKLNKLLIPITMFFLVLTTIVVGQTKKYILLNVNTDGLNPQEVKDKCYFEGQSPEDNPKFFVTVANVGDTLEWEGRSVNEEQVIYIKKVQRVSGPNIFNTAEIDNIEDERVVRAIIRNSTGRKPNGNIQYYRYKIQFRIDDATRGQVYTLDPLIRTNK